MDSRRDRIAIPEVGTTDWIWSNPSFVEWESAPSGILWIQGKPGSGKSVLAKSIQNHLSKSEDSSIVSIRARTIVGAWYYSTRHGLRAHRMMLKSLLLQVLEQDRSLFRHVKDFVSGGEEWSRYHKSHGFRWETLQEILLSISTSEGDNRQIFCVVDGLDESDYEGGDLEARAETLHFFNQLVMSPSRFKLICLSRPSLDIGKGFRHAHSIILQQVNLSDIEQIVDAGLSSITQALSEDDSSDEEDSGADYGLVEDDSNHRSTGTGSFPRLEPQAGHRKGRIGYKGVVQYFRKVKRVEADRLKDIRKYLIENARGVILWVTTILKTLETRAREPLCDLKQIERELYKLPKDLEKLYRKILKPLIETLGVSSIEASRRALLWVTVATAVRPFQLQELLDALAIGKDLKVHSWNSFRRQLQHLCGPFIEVIRPADSPHGAISRVNVRKDDEVQLLHQTVKDFLEDERTAGPLHLPRYEAQRMVKEEIWGYIEAALPSQPSDHVPLPVQPNSHWEHNVKVIASYLEERPLLPFIFYTQRHLLRTVPEVYKFMFQNTTSPPLTDLSEQRRAELEDSERSYASPDATKGQSAIIERFFRTACENGWVTTVENIFLLTSLRFSREQKWIWYHDQPAVIHGTLLAAIRHGMLEEVKSLAIHTAMWGIPIIYRDNGTEIRDKLLVREALQSRNEELALVVLGYADEIERQIQIENIRREHRKLPPMPLSESADKLLDIRKAIHAVLEFWGHPQAGELPLIYGDAADLGGKSEYFVIEEELIRDIASVSKFPAPSHPGAVSSLSYRRLIQEAKRGGSGHQDIYRSRVPPLASLESFSTLAQSLCD